MTAVLATSTSHLSMTEHDNMSSLETFLRREPHNFLQPTVKQQHAALAAVKAILDPLANDVAETQIARRSESRRKRKRGSDEVDDPVLQLRQIYTDGVGIKQVWEQARRVLDAACDEVERGMNEHLQNHDLARSGSDLSDAGVDVIGSGDEDDAGIGARDEPEDGSEHDGSEDREPLDDSDVADESEHDPDEMSMDDEEREAAPQATYKQDPNKLNDGFFSIDDFNKQSQFLEQMDARGDDDNPSDEDEIDWDADPLAQALAITPGQTANRTVRETNGQDDTVSEDDGPTFGNADLRGAESNSDDGMNDIDEGELDGLMSGLLNTNDVRYVDFFEPPPKKPSKTKRTRALPKTQPPANVPDVNGHNVDVSDADLERAIADVRRDLLDSEDEGAEDDVPGTDVSDDDGSDALLRTPSSKLRDKNLSTHEKQRLQIAEEIRRLESLNVSKKSWTLSGEASAGARPMNSLIEEDFEFERTGKPVPVITAEVSNDIEVLIKRRILARDFDEVVRRNPTALDAASGARRGRANVVVDDSKPTTSLGEMYESEFQRNTDPTSYIDKRSTATKKQHEEIDRLWKDVRDQLDVLSNLHIKPKRAEMEIKTVEDKPRITMEDAVPAISGASLEENGTLLAPQEIYKPGMDSRSEKGEVLNSKTGASRSKEEMTREEKTRKRRRDKERQKKASPAHKSVGSGKEGRKSKKDDQADVLKDLQKGGVKVIDRKRGLVDLSARKKKGASGEDGSTTVGGGAFKL